MLRVNKKQYLYSDLMALKSAFDSNNLALEIKDPEGLVQKKPDQNNQGDQQNQKKVLFNFDRNFSIGKNQYEMIFDFSMQVDFPDRKGMVERLYLLCQKRHTGFVVLENDEHLLEAISFLPGMKKANFIKRLRYKLGWHKLMSKTFRLWTQSNTRIDSLLSNYEYDFYNLYLGLYSSVNVPVVQLVKNGEQVRLIKFATSSKQAFFLDKEKSNVKRISCLEINGIQQPIFEDLGIEDTVSAKIGELNQLGEVTSKVMGKTYFLPLKELMIKSMKSEMISSTAFFNETLDYLTYLRRLKDGFDDQLMHRMINLMYSIPRTKIFFSSIAHGSFTQRNLAMKDGKLCAFDWSMALFGAPLLYDTFHFLYHTELVVKGGDVSDVEKAIGKLYTDDAFVDFIERFKIDIDLNHRLYLLHASLKFSVLKQELFNLDDNQETMLKGWKEMMCRLPSKTTNYMVRDKFFSLFIKLLSSKSYAIINFFGYAIDNLTAGKIIEVVLNKKDIAYLVKNLRDHAFIEHVVRKPFKGKERVKVVLIDKSFVIFDIVYSFRKMGWEFMQVNEVLNNAEIRNGFKVVNFRDNLKYLQVLYTLNEQRFPLNYQRVILSKYYDFPKRKEYLNYLKEELGLTYTKVLDSFGYSDQKKYDLIDRFREDNGVKRINWLKRLGSAMYNYFASLHNRFGFSIAFSGVDDPHKKVLIAKVKMNLENYYKKEVVIFNKLLGLKRFGKKEASHPQDQIVINDNYRSGLRLLFDIAIERGYVFFKYVLKGKIVIYENYYKDVLHYLSHAERKTISRLLIKYLIYRPNKNFYITGKHDDKMLMPIESREKSNLRSSLTSSMNYADLFNEIYDDKVVRLWRVSVDKGNQLRSINQIMRAIVMAT